MSVSNALRAERLVAKRYEERGYTVTVEPSQSAIPFELGGYRPDILATNGKEWLIIEVKSPGARVNKEMYREISRKAEQHPGWHFILITLNQEELVQTEAITSSNPTIATLRDRVEKLDRLASIEDSDGLLLPLYWGAYMAALRLLAGRDGFELGMITDFSLINKAYSEGIISFEDHESAKRLLDLRNQTVHGIEIAISENDCQELRQLIARVIERIFPTDH